MSLKQELEALKDEAAILGISELALWLYKKLRYDHIPAINLLSDNAKDAQEISKNVQQALTLLESRTDADKVNVSDLIQAANLLDRKKVNKETQVSEADATDLGSVIILLNAIKTKLNSMNS